MHLVDIENLGPLTSRFFRFFSDSFLNPMDDNSEVERLAYQRLYGGKQIYDWRTRRLRPEFPSEDFARKVLIMAKEIARKKRVFFHIYKLEKDLLSKPTME